MPQIAPILGSIAINLAIGVGASVLSQLIKPKQKQQTQSVKTSRGYSFEMTVGESVPVSAVLGKARARGQLVYVNEYGPNNDFLQLVIKIGHGWHDGLDTFLVDEKPAALTGSNASTRGRSVVPFTVGGTPYMWVKYYTGAPGQAADAELVARSNPVGRWTSAHKMTGCAYMIVTVRYNADLFGSTLPLFGSVWRGLRLYDWRDDDQVWGSPITYAFTRNPVVIRNNYRRGIFVNGVRVLGMGLSPLANDMAYYTAAANVCDEGIYYPETDETMARYEYGREVGDDEEKLSVLSELDASYCGSSFKRGGADAPIPAQQLVSLATLNDNDRLANTPIRVDRKGVVSQKRTMWHGQFVSADVGYGLAPFTPRINGVLESVLGGRKATALDQPYEDRQERAQSRAEIALRRQFYPATRVETFGSKALAYEPGDPITRNCEWGAMLMVVEKVSPLADRTGATLTLSEWSNLIVPASGDNFITLPEEPGAGPADPDRTIAVSGFGITPFSRTGGGAVHPYGKATWTPITDPNVDQVMIRVWPTSGTEADDKEDFFADSKLTSTKLVGPLQPLTQYTYKAIPVRRDARQCVWTNTATFTTGAETTPADVVDLRVDQLGRELQNMHGLVTGNNAGDIQTQLAALQRLKAELALALMDLSATTKESLDILTVQKDGGIAAVVRAEKAIVEQGRSFASLIEEVTASVNDLIASGLLSIEADVNELASIATILFKARASAGATLSQAALMIRAQADSMGGSDAYVGALSAFYVWETVDGEPLLVFKASAGGVEVLNLTWAGVQKSKATVGGVPKFIFDGDTGNWSLGA